MMILDSNWQKSIRKSWARSQHRLYIYSQLYSLWSQVAKKLVSTNEGGGGGIPH